MPNGQPWALMQGLRNMWGWDGYNGKTSSPLTLSDGSGGPSISVTFVNPRPQEEPRPINAVPQREQPIGEVKRLEPPRDVEIRTPFGHWKADPNGWMK